MKIFNFSLFLIATFSLSLLFAPIIVRAEDAVEDDAEEDAVINEDAESSSSVEKDEETTDELELSSPFVKTNFLFVEPAEGTELPAGRLVKLLIGFHNNATSSFLVEAVDASFRYPQDFTYHIQNFTSFKYNKVVDSDREATFEYMFTPSEAFSARQFGLTVNLRYKNAEGREYVNTVFNETVSITEPDEGFDGETFFLYVFLAAILVLLGLLGKQMLSTVTKKGRSSKPRSHAAPTSSNEVDMDWIPKHHVETQSNSPKTSPRLRGRQSTKSKE